MNCQIVMAYAYSIENGYYAAAYVLESNHLGLPSHNTFKVLFNYRRGESKEGAIQQCVDEIHRDNERHGNNMQIVNKGRIPLDSLLGCYF